MGSIDNKLIDEKDITVDSISSSEEKRMELEESFAYEGYQVVRKELFAHFRDPAMTIRPDSVSFNHACISSFEGVVYIHVLINEDLKRIVIESCDENDKDSLKWCNVKADKRVGRKMLCRDFAKGVYSLMDWDKSKRYKVLGYKIEFEGKKLYVFDLTVPEIFNLSSKKRKEAITIGDNNDHSDGDGKESVPNGESGVPEPKKTNKGYYDQTVLDSFGPSVSDHKKVTDVSELNGYVSMGIINGTNEEQKNI